MVQHLFKHCLPHVTTFAIICLIPTMRKHTHTQHHTHTHTHTDSCSCLSLYLSSYISTSPLSLPLSARLFSLSLFSSHAAAATGDLEQAPAFSYIRPIYAEHTLQSALHVPHSHSPLLSSRSEITWWLTPGCCFHYSWSSGLLFLTLFQRWQGSRQIEKCKRERERDRGSLVKCTMGVEEWWGYFCGCSTVLVLGRENKVTLGLIYYYTLLVGMLEVGYCDSTRALEGLQHKRWGGNPLIVM